MKIYDLHSHSTASDGSLSPIELITLAKNSAVDCFALTDHDCIDGIEEAKIQAEKLNLEFISGIEFSVSWRKYTIHIVGLNISSSYTPLLKGCNELKLYRQWRAEQIAKGLAEHGIKDALLGAKKFAHGKMIGRLHFADFLVEKGYCKDTRSVFKKFLVKNKPGYIHGQWASLEDVVTWINAAGGIAVIAHPGRYSFKNKMLKLLVKEFIELGGKAIEVVSGSHDIVQVKRISSIAQEFELYASMGSDFHNPEFKWNKLGKLATLPKHNVPVWQAWEL